MIEAKIEALLAEKFEEEAFSDCFLIEIKLRGKQKLEVFVDSDSGITFEKCTRISRYLEEHIEANQLLDEKYVLEVSSPGVGRPLKLKRQYHKNIGRTLEVKLKDWDKPKKGDLVRVNEAGIVLQETVTIKEGKKKRKEKVEVDIPFDAIEQSIVKISI